MNRFLVPISAVLAIAAGVFAWMQYDSASDLRRQIASYAAERDAALKNGEEIIRLKSALETAEDNIARLKKERSAALAAAKSSSPGVSPLSLSGGAPTGDDSGGKGMMEGIAKMFSTEEGKKMMRSQMAMGLKMQYGTLAKDLNLDPKVADQVFALLADRQLALTEVTFAAMKDGSLDDTAMKEIGTKSEMLQKEYDEKLKTVLGEQGMAQFNDYERTLGDRMMLSMHEQQFAATGSPLEAVQRDSLLQIMKEERTKTPASVFDSSKSGNPGKVLSLMRDDTAVEKWITQEEDYQQRVLQAATKTLNPDQINALQESFRQQLEMQRFGAKMSKQMFKGTGTQGTIIVAPSVKTDAPEK